MENFYKQQYIENAKNELKLLNKPFLKELWTVAEKETIGREGWDVLNTYKKYVCALPQYKNMTWKDSDHMVKRSRKCDCHHFENPTVEQEDTYLFNKEEIKLLQELPVKFFDNNMNFKYRVVADASRGNDGQSVLTIAVFRNIKNLHSLVNLETFIGLSFGEMGKIVENKSNKFNECDIILNTNGLSVGLLIHLTDVKGRIVEVKPRYTNDTEEVSLLLNDIKNKNLKFLMNHRDGQKIKSETWEEKLMAEIHYVNSDLLIEEMSNILVSIRSNGKMRLEKKDKGIGDSRFSCLLDYYRCLTMK